MTNDTTQYRPLKGEIALVTGASRGIGAAISDLLAAQGATVIGTATSDSGAQAIGERLAPLAGHGRKLDVVDGAAVDALIDSISKEFGPVSILVNNAGITRDNITMRMKDEEFDDVIATNLRGVFRLSRSVMRGMMKARSGRIINISSVVAKMGNAGQANYAAAKGGVEAMTRALAQELGSRNITVNCVAPGFIATDMTHAMGEGAAEALQSRIPLGRLGQAQDIANAVLFLASDSASYITGQVLGVNGGMDM